MFGLAADAPGFDNGERGEGGGVPMVAPNWEATPANFPFASLYWNTLLLPDFAGHPWNGSASGGTSTAHNFDEATNPPIADTAYNGHIPALFNGSTHLILTDGAARGIFGGVAGYTYAVVVKPNAAPAPTGSIFTDPAVLGDFTAAGAGLSFTSSGFQAYHYDATAGYSGPTGAASVSSWHVALGWYDGTTLHLSVDGVETTSPKTDSAWLLANSCTTALGDNGYGLASMDLMVVAGVDGWSSPARIRDVQRYLTATYTAAAAYTLTCATSSFAETGSAMILAVTATLTTASFVETGSAMTPAASLPCATVSFAETGTTTNLVAARIFHLTTQGFTETGQTMTPALALSCTTNSFTETGQTMTPALALSCTTNSFAETGQTMTPAVGLPCATNSFAETGQAMTPAAAMACTTSSFAETGSAATLAAGRIFHLATNSFVETGQTMTPALALSCTSGMVVETGSAMVPAAALPCASSAFAETGSAASLKAARIFTLATQGFTETGSAMTPTVSVPLATTSFAQTGSTMTPAASVPCTSAAFTEAGSSVNFVAARIFHLATNAFTETGSATTIAAGRIFALATQGFAETGSAMVPSVTIACTTSAFLETGSNAGVTSARYLSLATSAFLETASDAALEVGRVLPLAPSSFAEVGAAMTPMVALPCSSGSIVETGANMSPRAARLLSLVSAPFVESGMAANLTAGHVLAAAAGVLLVVGAVATPATAMVCDSSAFVETGSAANLDYKLPGKIVAVVAPFVVAVSEMVPAVVLPSSSAPFVEVGSAMTPTVGITCASSAFAETGSAMTPRGSVSCSTASFVETGTSPTLSIARYLSLATNAFIETGSAVDLRAAHVVAPTSSPFALVGSPVVPALGFVVASATFLESGQGLTPRLVVGLDVGSTVVDGADTGMLHGRAPMPLSRGVFTETGSDVHFSVHITHTAVLGTTAFVVVGSDARLSAVHAARFSTGAFTCAWQGVGLAPAFEHYLEIRARTATLITFEDHPANSIELHVRQVGTTIELTDEARVLIELRDEPKTRIDFMGISDFYDLGEDAEVLGLVRRHRSGELVDPTTLVARVQKPDKTVLTITYDNDVTEHRLVRYPGDSEIGDTPHGAFVLTIDCDQVGHWIVEWRTTGAGKAAEGTEFDVRAPRIPLDA